MRAMVINAPNTPFVMCEVPDPVPGPMDAVAKVLACGAGLTIQHVKAGRVAVPFPRIIGHEITAEIVELGSNVHNLAIGDAVTAYYYLNCGVCRRCVEGLEPLCENTGGNVGKDCDGGYAEFIKLPARNFIKLPEELDYQLNPAEIAVICDAIATPYKVNRRTSTRAGETVAVFGAGGGLGLHQVMISSLAGARVIAIDTKPAKFSACQAAGAQETLDASSVDVVEALSELTEGCGVDVAIDYVSTKTTLEQATHGLGVKGRMVTLGGSAEVFELDARQILLKEADVMGSRYVSYNEITESLLLVAKSEIWPIVSEIRPLAEAEAVHELVENGEVIGRAALLVG